MKVLMVDDETAMRERLSALLAGVANAQVRHVEQDATVAMLNAAAWRPDVVILDVLLRGAAAIRMLEAIKKEWPHMAVVISAWVEQPYGDVYLKCGADALLDKSCGWDDLGALLFMRAAQLASREGVQLQARAPSLDGRTAGNAVAAGGSWPVADGRRQSK